MITLRTHREAVQLAKRIGFDDARIEPGGKHSRLVVRIGQRERWCIVQGTGHIRVPLLRSDLRRMKRQMETTR